MDNPKSKQDREIEDKLKNLMNYTPVTGMNPMIVSALSMYEHEGYDVSKFKELLEIKRGNSIRRN